MSAPMIWIIFPVFVSSIAFFFRRWKSAVTIIVILITVTLAMVALLVPIGRLTTIGPWAFVLADRLVFAGRQFVLTNADRWILVIAYLTLAFFFSGSLSAEVSKIFVPMGLAMGAMLIASLSVQPFLYGALFIEIAVLLGVPILSPPGLIVERGVLRYIVFLSFGFPFMLVGGWLLSNLEFSEVIDPGVLLPALIVMGFGFAFLLAIFPLNTWIPILVERTYPYSALFVLTILTTSVITILLRFLRQYPWLLDFDVILFLGVLMVITGGLWSAFQRNLGRLLGYAVIVEIGYSIIAVSQPDGLPIYTAILLPCILAFGVWALSLSLIRNQVKDLSFRAVQGLGRRIPLVVLGVLVAHFSLAGFPLLASFPMLLMLWSQLVQFSHTLALLVLLSNIGLLTGALRSLAVFVMGPDEMPLQDYKINRISQLLILFGILTIVVIGLFPAWFYRFVLDVVGLK